MPDKTPIIECVECETRYSLQDIIDKRYFPSTHVCLACYKRMQKAAYADSCFGKPDNGPHKRAYKPLAVACRLLCPDRQICRKFVAGARMRHEMTDDNVRAVKKLLLGSKLLRTKIPRTREHPFQEGTLTRVAFDAACSDKGITDKQLDALVKQYEGCPGSKSRLVRIFKLEMCYGFDWTYSERDGVIRLAFTDRSQEEAKRPKRLGRVKKRRS